MEHRHDSTRVHEGRVGGQGMIYERIAATASKAATAVVVHEPDQSWTVTKSEGQDEDSVASIQARRILELLLAVGAIGILPQRQTLVTLDRKVYHGHTLEPVIHR